MFESFIRCFTSRSFNYHIEPEFSGFGVVFYEGDIENLPISPLLKNNEVPSTLVGDIEVINFLFEISKYSDSRHDGFHFVHQTNGLSKLSQFFSAPIPKNYKPKKYNVGSRYRVAELGSLLGNVVGIIICHRDGSLSVFSNGIELK